MALILLILASPAACTDDEVRLALDFQCAGLLDDWCDQKNGARRAFCQQCQNTHPDLKAACTSKVTTARQPKAEPAPEVAAAAVLPTPNRPTDTQPPEPAARELVAPEPVAQPIRVVVVPERAVVATPPTDSPLGKHGPNEPAAGETVVQPKSEPEWPFWIKLAADVGALSLGILAGYHWYQRSDHLDDYHGAEKGTLPWKRFGEQANDSQEWAWGFTGAAGGLLIVAAWGHFFDFWPFNNTTVSLTPTPDGGFVGFSVSY